MVNFGVKIILDENVSIIKIQYKMIPSKQFKL